MSIYYYRPSTDDPENSSSVFERGVFNEFGEPYCVEASLTHDQARRLCDDLNTYVREGAK